MKIEITGASAFVTRMFEACGTYQWAREFLRNAIEAAATKVEFGIEWQAVEKLGVYRRTIVDNGQGMTGDELRRFFSTLGAGGKKIGGVHDNFGVGAKIAALPWNPEGMVVISYKNGIGSMIWIVFDESTGDYELVEFEVDKTTKCVVEPQVVEGINWAAVKPEWLTDNGTIVVLLGSAEHPDTVLGNPNAGEQDLKGLSIYLNNRFWDLTGLEVKVAELRSDKKSHWPQSILDKDNGRRPNNRTIRGARHFLTGLVGSDEGAHKCKGEVSLADGRVTAEWYLWEGQRPSWVHQQAKKQGYIAVRYKGELFQLTSSKPHFRWFGVIENKVQQNLTIILEPKHYEVANGKWGVHSDQSRNRLIFSGDGDQGIELPLSDWALDFAESMPEEILEAIRAARGDKSGTIEDGEYRKRLQDKFGSRWTVKGLVAANSNESSTATGTAGNDRDTASPTERGESKKRASRGRSKSSKVARKVATAPGSVAVVEADVPVDVPRYRFGGKDNFQSEFHLAVWAPNDPEGPSVVINVDSPILEEIVKYHQDQYPDVYAEEVADTVREVFGEVAACKIAHSQKLAKHISEDELNRDYRSEQALTIALMGLLAEEAVIGQRLAKLGRKKAA